MPFNKLSLSFTSECDIRALTIRNDKMTRVKKSILKLSTAVYKELISRKSKEEPDKN